MEYAELAKLPRNTLLTQMGLGSIQFIQFVVMLEDDLGIELLDSDLLLSNFQTLEALYATLQKYFHPERPIKKVLICDCDNVLWHGIAGEEEIYIDKVAETLQKLILELYSQGVLICLCSKNEPENVTHAFKQLHMPLESRHILLSKINRSNKVSNLQEIAAELNLAPDSFVFIDDSDYEIGLVSAMLPEVATVKVDYSHPAFLDTIRQHFAQTPAADADRTRQYREQKEREKAKSKYTSVEAYNSSLQTKVLCDIATPKQAARISELSQRTNQFNLSATKYTEAQILQFIQDDSYCVYTLSASDIYGNMGIVGAAVVHLSASEYIINSFFLSCRVFDRNFEELLLNKIKSDCPVQMFGIYKQTAQNKRFRDFYPKHDVILYNEL